MRQLQQKARALMAEERVDFLACAVIDFAEKTFQSFELSATGENDPIAFDLASLTKPLTLAAAYCAKPQIFSEPMHWMLNHRAGLPAWGRLARQSWREELLSFTPVRSEALYSDYSALRLMLELEKVGGGKLKDICRFFWDVELFHWCDPAPDNVFFLPTGLRDGRTIRGEVHDDNAYVLGGFCSHAGLFATAKGLARSLLKLDQETHLLEQMGTAFTTFKRSERFLNGWDTSEKWEETFGHLGFTGCSLWISCPLKRGFALLTNACYPYARSRSGLQRLRNLLGESAWH